MKVKFNLLLTKKVRTTTESGKRQDEMARRLPAVKPGPKFSGIILPIWVILFMTVARTHNFQTKIMSSVPFDKTNPKHKIRVKDRADRTSRKEKARRRKNSKAKRKSASKKLNKLDEHPMTSSFADSDSSQPTSTEVIHTEVIHTEGKEGHNTVKVPTA